MATTPHRTRTWRANADERRAAALARVKLYAVETASSRLARGLLRQLVAGGFVPEAIAADEAERRPIEWCDLDGRACVLRPYGRLQWELRIFRLPHEADEMRAIKADHVRARELRHAREAQQERERRELADLARCFPTSPEAFRDGLCEFADLVLAALEREISGHRLEGCSIDADSQDEIRTAASAIRGTLAAATYRYNPAVRERLQARLRAFDAKHDEQLQGVLRQARAA